MTFRIELITTGKCEQVALGASLERVLCGADMRFETHHKGTLNSFTSSRLSCPPPLDRKIPTEIDKVVSALAEALSRRDSPDFVFVVDDLELVNIDTPQHVVASVRDAVLRSEARRTHREIEALRQRCSVHFLCPMLEGYFYGEPAALIRAGARTAAALHPDRSLEAFQSVDGAFMEFSDVPRQPWRKATAIR